MVNLGEKALTVRTAKEQFESCLPRVSERGLAKLPELLCFVVTGAGLRDGATKSCRGSTP